MHAPLSRIRRSSSGHLPFPTIRVAAVRRIVHRAGRLATRLVAAASLSLVVLGAGAAFAAEPINTLERSGLFGYKPSDVAIRGYDTVAYFTEGRPVEGSEAFESEWQGATWRFASQEHLDLFEADPTRYAPQYGGYCAYGVAGGYLVKIEPENWTILDGKLYLNYDDEVQAKWEKDIPGFIAEANSTFETLLATE